MNIDYIRAFKDNYIWVIKKENNLILVDPGDENPVLEYIGDKNLVAILLTHMHDDHVAGALPLKEKYPHAIIIGPAETSDINDKTVKDGDSFTLLAYDFLVIKTAGHTDEHISYITEDKLFCGDSLFSSGSGRCFTGNFQKSFDGIKKIRSLDKETFVYPAHEYTIRHLTSSKKIIKDRLMDEALKEAEEKLNKNIPSLPTTIAKEYKINPYFRAKNVEEFKKYYDIKNK